MSIGIKLGGIAQLSVRNPADFEHQGACIHQAPCVEQGQLASQLSGLIPFPFFSAIVLLQDPPFIPGFQKKKDTWKLIPFPFFSAILLSRIPRKNGKWKLEHWAHGVFCPRKLPVLPIGSQAFFLPAAFRRHGRGECHLEQPGDPGPSGGVPGAPDVLRVHRPLERMGRGTWELLPLLFLGRVPLLK